MKNLIVLMILITFPLKIHALELETILEIESKPTLSNTQALTVFSSICENLPADEDRNTRFENIKKIYNRDDVIFTKGAAAKILAEILNLDNSFFYQIFRTERYAFRACVAAGIMSIESDISEPVSGNELLEFALKIQQYHGVP